MTENPDDEISALDRDALERALAMAERTPARAQLLTKKLKGEPWSEVASFAAYVVQGAALGLRPWQEPPAVADEDDPNERDKDAQRLLRRMLAAGLSRYEPDPKTALAKSAR